MKEYVGVVRNNDFRYTVADGQKFDTIMQAEFQLAVNEERDNFDHKGTTYDVMKEGEDYYSISANGTMLAIAAKDIVNVEGAEIPFDVKYDALKAYTNEVESFTVNGKEYGVDEDGNILDGETVLGYISRFVVSSASADVVPGRVFKEELEIAIDNDEEEFTFTGEDGVENSYKISYDPTTLTWSVKQGKETYVYDSYANPGKEHWLGTDSNGMDMLTRLMYGGRVSLIIGFIVVIIETVLGVILGGLAGYFGKWVDMK